MEYRGATHICTGKHDQKNERDIHENAKAKLSVCCLQELCRLNNNSVIITNKQNNFEQKYELYWSGYAFKKQHGVGITIKVDKGTDRRSYRWVPELLLLLHYYMGAPYELFVVMHLPKSNLINQNKFYTVNWINNLNMEIHKKS